MKNPTDPIIGHKTLGVLSNLKNDFTAGFVIFLLALPLCLGIALGAPLYSALIAGIIGKLGGCQLASHRFQEYFML